MAHFVLAFASGEGLVEVVGAFEGGAWGLAVLLLCWDGYATYGGLYGLEITGLTSGLIF